MFEPGTRVKYHETEGEVNFVSTEYLTICIKRGQHRVNDVNLVVYPYNWSDIEPIKQEVKDEELQSIPTEPEGKPAVLCQS